MKKILAMALLAVCFTWNIGLAYDLTVTGTSEDVGKEGRKVRYTYTSSTSIVTGADKVVKINTPYVFGNSIAWSFESSSPDCDVFISETDGAAITDADTKLGKEGINLGWTPELSAPVYFRNGDTTETEALYVTIGNDSATGTGTWVLTIVFGDNN